MAPLPGLVKDPSPPATETELSPITIPDGTILITTLQHNKIIDYLSGDAFPDFIPQSAIDTLVTDLAGKEDTVNKGAVSGYAALDASQLLLLANFPSGTALQVLRRNAGDTALEFADPASGEVFTWTDDHDANTFDLLNMKQLTFADDTAPDTALASIFAQNTGNISINARATEFIFLRIGGVQQYNFGLTAADFLGHDLEGVNSLELELTGTEPAASANFLGVDGSGNVVLNVGANDDFIVRTNNGANQVMRLDQNSLITTSNLVLNGSFIDLDNNQFIRWVTDDQRIEGNTAGIEYRVSETGDTHEWFINNISELLLDNINGLDLKGNQLINVTDVLMQKTGVPVLEMYNDTNGPGSGVVSTSFNFFSEDVNGTKIAIASIDATTEDDSIANPSGGLQFRLLFSGTTDVLWMAFNDNNGNDIDILKPVNMNNQNLTMGTGDIIFQESTQFIQSSTGGISVNIPSNDNFTIFINTVNEYSFSASGIDMNGNNIDDVGSWTGRLAATNLINLQDLNTLADDTTLGEIRWRGDDGLGVTVNYARITGVMESDVDAAEEGSMQFFVQEAGAEVPYMSFNDASSGIIDILKTLNMNDQGIDNVSSLTMTGRLDMADSTEIRWAGIANRRILNNTTGFFFDVALGDTYTWNINSALEMTLSSTGLNMNGGRIEEINFIEFIGAGTEADAGDIRFNVNSDIAWRNNADDGNLLLSINASDELVFDGNILFPQGESQTPWIADIDAATFDLFGLGILSFTDVDTSIQQASADMQLDVATGGAHVLRVNNVAEFEFDVVAGFVSSRRIQGNQGGDVASAATITLGNDGNYFDITGNTDVDFMTITDWQAGAMVTLQFDGNVTVNDNTATPPVNTVPFAIAGNFVAGAGDTLTVILDGAFWREISRSVN